LSRFERIEKLEAGPLKVNGPVVATVNQVSRLSSSTALLNAFLELVKIRITFFVGMSAAFGYILAANNVSINMILPVFGIFLLSCGSAVLNHYQERTTDSLMHRTNERPLPTGIVSPTTALVLVFVLAISGGLMVYLTSNFTALVLSLMAFLWYNAIYTPMKKVTAFAVIPGSFVGALPVMAGWAAAGGSILDPRLIAVSVFFFIWQIPHFWLLMDIYSYDYERAGFPTLRKYFGKKTLAVLTFAWIVILSLTSLLFITTKVVNNIFVDTVIVMLGSWLVVGTHPIILNSGDKRIDKAAFLKINVYVLAVTLLVMIDKVLNFF